MWRSKRYRTSINDFAIPRMEPGEHRPIQSMEEAPDWERVFIGEVKAEGDPRRVEALVGGARARIQHGAGHQWVEEIAVGVDELEDDLLEQRLKVATRFVSVDVRISVESQVWSHADCG